MLLLGPFTPFNIALLVIKGAPFTNPSKEVVNNLLLINNSSNFFQSMFILSINCYLNLNWPFPYHSLKQSFPVLQTNRREGGRWGGSVRMVGKCTHTCISICESGRHTHTHLLLMQLEMRMHVFPRPNSEQLKGW